MDKSNILGDVLKDEGKDINFIFAGNSIASGYSISHEPIPLFERLNINKCGINIDMMQIARAINNSDGNTFDMFINDITKSDIYRLLESDYFGVNSSLPKTLTKENFDKYYANYENNQTSLHEMLYDKNKNVIIIYSGMTGSFLDLLTREKDINLFKGKKRANIDIAHIHSILTYIQNKNRLGSNIQIYLIGAPNIPVFSELLNIPLKRATKSYANVNFVPETTSQILYRDQNKKPCIDIHYNQKIYERVCEKIINSIIQNYTITNILINIDRLLKVINEEIYMSKITSNNYTSLFEETLYKIINKTNLNSEEKYMLYQKIIELINYRYSTDYYLFTKKRELKQITKNLINA